MLIFSGMSCPLIVIAYKLKRTEIRLTAIIPCGSSSFLISSLSMLSSSTHLMTNFLEFNVRWGVTLTGIEPISIVVLKRFLLWCFFSTSIKMLPDFIGLHCLGRPFAMPSTAFLSVNTFSFSLLLPWWGIVAIDCHFHLSHLVHDWFHLFGLWGLR